MTHRFPRAIHDTAQDDAAEDAPREDSGQQPDVANVLKDVRETATDLLESSPEPPSTLNVRAGDVAVEMGWSAADEPAAPAASGTPAARAEPAEQAKPTEPTEAAEAAGPTITATTVGTFYRASAPGAAPFVSEGDEVGPGQQVAIIEAMKLMLPVEAEHGGRIAEVLVADGEGVEFGQPLFRLTADSELAA